MSEPGKAVFLSYASQDAEAAKRICDALRAAGVEVWFDQSELVGGDQWDGKIRGQISSCALFMPIISANTQARLEGYFRLEWKLAAQRTHTMADEKTFLLPILIDGTRDADAKVPSEFKSVQWTKLPGGETPVAFCARVKALLDGDVGRDLRIPPSSDKAGFGDPALQRNRRLGRWWWALPIFGVTMALMLVIKEKRATPVAPTAPTVTPANPAAPISEARQKAWKARQLFEAVDSTKDDYMAAEGLLQSAVKLDTADGLIWAIYSRLNTGYSMRGFDRSSARTEDARSQMERAIRLAPDEPEVWFARGTYLRRIDGDRADAEQALRKALAMNPDDTRPWFDLAWAIDNQQRDEEVIALLEKSIDPKRPGSDALAHYNVFNLLFGHRRFAEADAIIRKAVAELSSANFVTGLIRSELTWKGDPAGARAAIRQLSPERLREPRSVAFAAYAYLVAHDPAAMLAALQRLPADFIEDTYFTGPKAYWEGWAQAQLGRTEAARLAWESALAVCRREGAGRGGRGLFVEAELLALLGREADAVRALAVYEQAGGKDTRLFSWNNSPARIHALLGKADEALPLLEALLKLDRAVWPLTPALLRVDPRWDKIRNDPRFQSLATRDQAATAATVASSSAKAPAVAEAMAGKTEDSSGKASRPDEKSVAVLAFANLSEDKANEYFSDGISEELLNVLAKVPGLKVSARTSAFYFKGKEVPVPEIAKQLGVAYVVEGSVRKQGEKVRITAQLIKAADGFHVWSDTFTRDLKDIFAVQDEIAGLIAKNLELKMGLGSAQAHHSVEPEALRLMLEGRYFLTLRSSAGFDRADRAFTAALKIDPLFAQAQAGLASTTALRGRYRLLDGVGQVAEFDQLAIAQSRLALQIDPTLAEPHATLGFVFTDTWQLADAEKEFRLAIGANPNFATAYHWHSHVLAAQGRLDLALQEIERAEALDPVSFIILFIRGFYLSDARRYPEALATLDRAAAIRGETFLPLESDRARVLLALGRTTEALTAARKILQDPRLISSGWYAAGEALYVLHSGGAAEEANRLAPAILQAMPAGSYQRGYVLCAIGRFSEGLQALAHIPDIVRSRLYWHPMLVPVRDTPEFRQMLENFNLVAEYEVAQSTLARMQPEQAGKAK